MHQVGMGPEFDRTPVTPEPRRPWAGLGLAAFTWVVWAESSLGVGPEAPDQVGLRELAALVSKASVAEQGHFAHCALQELERSYGAEAARARESGPEPQRASGRWVQATEGFRGQVGHLANRLAQGAQVAVAPGPGDQVYLYIDNRPMVLEGPRVAEPGGLARSVLSCYCTAYPCHPRLVPPDPAAGQSPVAPVERDARLKWTFSAGSGSVCEAGDGLELRFRGSDQLARKRVLCQQVARELQRVAERLRELQGYRESVDWDTLAVQSTAEEGVQQLVFNRQGAKLRLALPTLGAHPAVVAEAACWLADRAAGREGQVTIENADRLLAQGGGPTTPPPPRRCVPRPPAPGPVEPGVPSPE